MDRRKPEIKSLLLGGLTENQKKAVCTTKRRSLVVAGAGSGKTDVMARRVVWWIAVDDVPKDSIVAFTFMDSAAEEMKFRIRQYVELITPEDEDATLGGMYIGTIHGFCLKLLRELWPDIYHNFDILDESGRIALVQRGYYRILGLKQFRSAVDLPQFATIDTFLQAYDLLNEYDQLEVELASSIAPHQFDEESDWCKKATLHTHVGDEEPAQTFAISAARYYAFLRCRRFLDFSTSQSELLRSFRHDGAILDVIRQRSTHFVVDEVQDINPVQDKIIRTIVGDKGVLTSVGDHRQAIFGWRGGRVDIMAALFEELNSDPDGEVTELEDNFRSTPCTINLANEWASTIERVGSMSSPDMKHGNIKRTDFHPTHVAAIRFPQRLDESRWIGEKVRELVRRDETGATHDTRDGLRGITYSDIAILLRSATDARTYMVALEELGVPAVFQGGPHLFSQPEVLLFIAALARMAGIDRFYGSQRNPRSLPNRVLNTLGCQPTPEEIIPAACCALRASGLPVDEGAEERILLATELIHARISGEPLQLFDPWDQLRSPKLVEWLRGAGTIRRVFPQKLFHFLLSEVDVGEWESIPDRGRTAMFHLGALSSLVKGIETPGWTTGQDFKYQMTALYLWGSRKAGTEEAPLLVSSDAVTISTIHGAKGLEYPVVFLADVCANRFPSGLARRVNYYPFDGPILEDVDPTQLADNENYDNERRLMYVALTRAERYLFVTCSGSRRSQFFRSIEKLVEAVGGTVGESPEDIPTGLEHRRSEFKRDIRLVTSFSDLRYFLECPHDFYLRKVLGFAPTIDQTFGYGRGVHNIMRTVHTDPAIWAELVKNPGKLKAKIQELIESGLFYLRYTTGEPAENMRKKAVRIVADYIKIYAPELARLYFEPEREFEILIEEEQVLVSGVIDVIRLDDPPRVTLLDFKSGETESDTSTKLDEDEMRLQVSLYGLGAKRELEYEPEKGLVRYLDEKDPDKREISVDLDDRALDSAKSVIINVAREIRDRNFDSGPRKKPRNEHLSVRCGECDFVEFCGMREAKDYRTSLRSS